MKCIAERYTIDRHPYTEIDGRIDVLYWRGGDRYELHVQVYEGSYVLPLDARGAYEWLHDQLYAELDRDPEWAVTGEPNLLVNYLPRQIRRPVLDLQEGKEAFSAEPYRDWGEVLDEVIMRHKEEQL